MTTAQTTALYTIHVPIITTWSTGAMRGTATKIFHIEEEASVLGAMRAMNIAIQQCNWYEDKSPSITPNPTELGWPISL